MKREGEEGGGIVSAGTGSGTAGVGAIKLADIRRYSDHVRDGEDGVRANNHYVLATMRG